MALEAHCVGQWIKKSKRNTQMNLERRESFFREMESNAMFDIPLISNPLTLLLLITENFTTNPVTNPCILQVYLINNYLKLKSPHKFRLENCTLLCYRKRLSSSLRKYQALTI